MSKLGTDLRTAQTAAYAAVERIHFEGTRVHHDIAAKALLIDGGALPGRR